MSSSLSPGTIDRSVGRSCTLTQLLPTLPLVSVHVVALNQINIHICFALPMIFSISFYSRCPFF